MDSKAYHDEKKAVFGIYPTHASVEAGVTRLKAEGFLHTDISVLMPEKAGSQKFAPSARRATPGTAWAATGRARTRRHRQRCVRLTTG